MSDKDSHHFHKGVLSIPANGSHSRVYEHIYFEVNTLEDVLREVRRLGQPGALTINFGSDGRPAGKGEFKVEIKK